jgi:2-polyprenyl-6-hydroxyphenyl methylase/3-demethylubiquinone-9 3-methyltransferase
MTLYVCAECDFHYIDALDDYPEEQPGPLLKGNALKYIEAQLPQNGVQLRKNLEFVKQHIALPGSLCLDIGSGAGQFPAFLQEEGAHPQGIEPQQVFREFARQKYNLELRSERVEDAYWQKTFSASFDLVTLWDTLEHVNFPAETMADACALLKPGGYLFLDTPSRDTFFYRASEWSYRLSLGSKPALLNRLYSSKPYRHKQIFTADQLMRLLEKCGLTVLGRSAWHRSTNKLVVACRKDPH